MIIKFPVLDLRDYGAVNAYPVGQRFLGKAAVFPPFLQVDTPPDGFLCHNPLDPDAP